MTVEERLTRIELKQNQLEEAIEKTVAKIDKHLKPVANFIINEKGMPEIVYFDKV